MIRYRVWNTARHEFGLHFACYWRLNLGKTRNRARTPHPTTHATPPGLLMCRLLLIRYRCVHSSADFPSVVSEQAGQTQPGKQRQRAWHQLPARSAANSGVASSAGFRRTTLAGTAGTGDANTANSSSLHLSSLCFVTSDLRRDTRQTSGNSYTHARTPLSSFSGSPFQHKQIYCLRSITRLT